MKSIFNKPLQIVASIYGLLYFAGFALPFITGETTDDHFERFSGLGMFLFFLIGLIFSWIHEKIGGLLFQIWYLFIWVLSYYFWPEDGLVIVLSFPVLIIGVFMYQHSFVKATKNSLSKLKIKKHLLVVFMLNYVVLYAATAIPKLFENFNKYIEQPFVIFPLLFLLFLISFVLSWEKELFAGIFLIIWYLVVLISSFTSDEIFNEAPTFAMGFALLIQGILFIKYSIQKKKLSIST